MTERTKCFQLPDADVSEARFDEPGMMLRIVLVLELELTEIVHSNNSLHLAIR